LHGEVGELDTTVALENTETCDSADGVVTFNLPGVLGDEQIPEGRELFKVGVTCPETGAFLGVSDPGVVETSSKNGVVLQQGIIFELSAPPEVSAASRATHLEITQCSRVTEFLRWCSDGTRDNRSPRKGQHAVHFLREKDHVREKDPGAHKNR
jgi:hypothetical protein